MKQYEVKVGDSIQSIASKMCGSKIDSMRLIRKIVEINGINDVIKIKPGMILNIPEPINIENPKEFIADHYGLDIQEQQLIEEMAELTQAICKDKRSRGQGQEIGGTWLYSNIKKNLIEELADVKLVLSQVIYLLDCEDQVTNVMNEKIERTMNRIGDDERRWQ